jgi:hypothetical protein
LNRQTLKLLRNKHLKGKSDADIEKSEHETGESSSGRPMDGFDDMVIEFRTRKISGHVYAYAKANKKRKNLKFLLENWNIVTHPMKNIQCYAGQ